MSGDAADHPQDATPPQEDRRGARSDQVLQRLRRRDGGWLGALSAGAFGLLVVALWGVTWLGRGWFAPPGWFAALVMFLPYLYGSTLVVGFLLWTLIPDRRSLPVYMMALLISGGLLWGPTWSSQGETATGETVRMMSWNLRRLWGGPEEGREPLACVVATLEQQQPQVVALMEVSAQNVEAIEAATDLSCVHHTYRSDQGPKSGGLATCVRGGWTLEAGSGQRFVDVEDWYYVLSEVRRGNDLFNVLAVHLTPYDYGARRLRAGVEKLAQGDPSHLADLERSGEQVVKGQSDQAMALLQRVQRLQHPTVVAGDFNSTRDAALHTALRRHLVDTYERGGFGFGGTVDVADWLPLRIDYIYASPRFAVHDAEVVAAGCSDHRPVVSVLSLSE